MSTLRFNHVFVFVMLVGALSAFVLPAQLTDHAKGKLDTLLLPVARPVRAVALSASSRLGRNDLTPRDDRNQPQTAVELKRQNEALRSELASLTVQLEELKKLNADRDQLGNVRRLCEPFGVFGGDSGSGDSLSLQSLRGSSLDHLRNGMPVLCPEGLVGRVAFASMTAARVQLITDKRFSVTAHVAAYVSSDDSNGEHWQFVRRKTMPLVSVSGNGEGGLVVTQLSTAQVREFRRDSGFAVGDWLVVDDRDFPMPAQGQRLGVIDTINETSKHALFGEVIARPRVDLRRLSEVMVMVKK